jgi:RNA 2',3'-cyclic 3'-phosphodiesterase
MATQSSLLFGEKPPRRRPTDRLFLAIVPHAHAAAQAAAVAARLSVEHGLKGNSLPPERLHASLHHVGDYPDLPRHIIRAVHDIASRVALRPFVLAFDRVISFRGMPGHRPLVLTGGDGVAGLLALQQIAGPMMAQAGLGQEMRAFTPHMTLQYGDALAVEQEIEPIAWTVREFVLVHSLLGRSKHIPIARFPLRG